MRLILAIRTRELKTSLFLAVSSLDNVAIVATANSTGELLSYCRTLRPDVVVVESGLPGRGLDETVVQLGESMTAGRILIVDGAEAKKTAEKHPNVEEFSGIEMLIEAVP